MFSRDKPGGAVGTVEYGARKGLAGSNRELQAPRENVDLNSNLERAIILQLERRTIGVFRG